MDNTERSAMKDLLPWLLMAALTVSWILDRNAPAPTTAYTVPAVEVAAEAPPDDPGQVFQLANLVAQLKESMRCRPAARTGSSTTKTRPTTSSKAAAV